MLYSILWLALSSTQVTPVSPVTRWSKQVAGTEKEGGTDYWSEDFDENQNCKQKEKINELKKKVMVRLTELIIANLHWQEWQDSGKVQCSSEPVSQ